MTRIVDSEERARLAKRCQEAALAGDERAWLTARKELRAHDERVELDAAPRAQRWPGRAHAHFAIGAELPELGTQLRVSEGSGTVVLHEQQPDGTTIVFVRLDDPQG